MPETRYSICALDCPDACSIKVTVENGRAVKLQGDPEHPVTRGFLCAKVQRYLDREYHPERLLYPMKRTGPKGSREFTRITWDEALDSISSKLKHVAEEHGPEAILPYSYGGNLGYLNGNGMDRRFFHRLGASQLDRTICASAGAFGLTQAYGIRLGTDTERFDQAKLIIAWGANILATSVHQWPFIVEARRNGARFVVIDPVRTKTARLADQHIAIHPGTDVVLMLGMLHVIFAEGLEDREYMEKYAEKGTDLRAFVADMTPEAVYTETGVEAETVRQLARLYATTKPALLRINYGIQRSEWGATAVRVAAMLPVVCGHWKHMGGGLQLTTSGAFQINRKALEMPELMEVALGRTARTLNMSELGRILEEVNDPPVKALFVYNSNPAAIAPNRNRVKKGLLREDLFTVVAEQFLTDTTDYADIVLPATTFLENKDLYFSYGHYWMQYAEPAIEAPGECKSNVELFRLLAERMGFKESCFRDSEDEMIAQTIDSGHEFLKGVSLPVLQAERRVRLHAAREQEAFAEGGFGTVSGKVNLSLEGFQYRRPEEGRLSPLAKQYPLELISLKHADGMNSTFGHREGMVQEVLRLVMHPGDASVRGIAAGDMVEAFNGRGMCRFVAEIDGEAKPGLLAASGLTWSRLRADGESVNNLTGEKLTDFGGGPTFFNCLVEVRKCVS